jgi:amidophosphoribosyltransferase
MMLNKQMMLNKSMVRGRTATTCVASIAAKTTANISARAPGVVGSESSGLFNVGGLRNQVALQNSRMAKKFASSASTPKRSVARMCGIIAIHKATGNASVELYEGLLMLQHRGQDSAGMVTTDWSKFKEFKENGLVKDVFGDEEVMASMEGNCGIAHVRYPTAGSSSAQEAQPFFVNSPLGMYLIHNGNLTNAAELREILNSSKSFFNRHMRTESDSEVLLNILADEVHRAHQRCIQTYGCDPNTQKTEFVFEATANAMKMLKGAYSCLLLVMGVGTVGFRDPFGIRPLMLGSRPGMDGKTEWCIASEDCAFGPIGFTRVRDVNPGEIVIITPSGELLSRQVARGTLNPCIFEYIYLARPDSVLNSIPVYDFQLKLGTCLAKRITETGWDIDIVVPVPDGSRPAAIQIAADLNLPYREGLVKNRYVGRTFIMPDQRLREMSVRRKLNAMPTVFEGKNVLLIDDSIVRGTTMKQIVEMVRKAGARRVYLASASPPVIFPNVYGVDMPSKKEFVANGLTIEEVREVLGADGLIYQTVDDLFKVGMEMNPAITKFDASCFNGEYVTGDIDEEYLEKLEKQGRGKKRVKSGVPSNLIGSGLVVNGAQAAVAV